MREITIYDPKTGAVLGRTAVRDGEDAAIVEQGLAWTEEVGDRIDPATGRAASFLPNPASVSGNTVSGIPEGSKVIVNDVSVEPVKGEIKLRVAMAETVEVRIYHPTHEDAVLHVACTPEASPATGYAVPQDYARLRLTAYPPRDDQLDALWKLVGALAAGRRASMPADALPVLDQVAGAKTRFPKEPK